MNSTEIAAFEAKILKLAADGKIPSEVLGGISRLIAKINELQTEVNRLRTHRTK